MTEDIEALLVLADEVRNEVESHQLEKVIRKIEKAVQLQKYEAFDWIIGVLEETYAKKSFYEDICVKLGNQIPDYSAFIENIEAKEPKSPVIKILSDKNKEVESFDNILVRKTKYPHMYLISIENYDLKDRDSIIYELVMTKHIDNYVV